MNNLQKTLCSFVLASPLALSLESSLAQKRTEDYQPQIKQKTQSIREKYDLDIIEMGAIFIAPVLVYAYVIARTVLSEKKERKAQ